MVHKMIEGRVQNTWTRIDVPFFFKGEAFGGSCMRYVNLLYFHDYRPFLNTLCSRFCSWSMLFLSLNILPSLETCQRKEIIQVIVSIKSMRMTSCKQLYSLSQPSSGLFLSLHANV